MIKNKILKKIIIAILLSFLFYKSYILIRIDLCLDGGGVWDYPKQTCIKYNLSEEEMKCLSKKGTWNVVKKICEEKQ